MSVLVENAFILSNGDNTLLDPGDNNLNHINCKPDQEMSSGTREGWKNNEKKIC